MRTTILLAMALPALFSCASTPERTPDTPAQYIACHGARHVADAPVRVVLRFTIDQAGRPLPGTAIVLRELDSYSPEWAVSEAKMILTSCEFEPALHDGKPVSSLHSMPIYVQPRSHKR